MKTIFATLILLCFATSALAGGTITIGKKKAVAASFPTNGVLSAFTGTDNTTPTGFTDVIGNIQITSNTAKGTGATDNVASWGTTYTADHIEGYVTITTVSTTTGHSATIFLLDGSLNGYALLYEVTSEAANDTLKVKKVAAGSVGAQVGSTTTLEMATGYSFGLSANAGTLKMWGKASGGSWAQLGSNISDATYSTMNQIYMGIYSTTIRLDDFGGGTASD